MSFWTKVKTEIKNALEEIQKNSVLDALATSALERIPVVGGLLVKLYEIGTGSNKDKTGEIIQILKNFEQMDEDGLKQEIQKLEKNRKNILENRNYLKQLVYDTSKILDELHIAKQERKENTKELKAVGQANQKLLLEILNRLPIPKDISSEKEIIIPKAEAEHIKNLYTDIMPLSNDDLLKLANTFYFMKKNDQAISLYDRILVQNPNNVTALNNKGATEYFNTIIKIDIRNVSAWSNKGFALHNLERYDEAIRCYDKVLEIDPEHVSAWYNKGFALHNLER